MRYVRFDALRRVRAPRALLIVGSLSVFGCTDLQTSFNASMVCGDSGDSENSTECDTRDAGDYTETADAARDGSSDESERDGSSNVNVGVGDGGDLDSGDMPDPCASREVTPGVFHLPEVQTYDLDLGPVRDVLVANINGDDYDDLVYNSRDDASNEVAVLLGRDGGRFALGPRLSHPEPKPFGLWTSYQLQTGDVDGDGDDDLVWNYNLNDGEGQRRNVWYVALSGNAADSDFELTGHESQDPAGVNASYPMFLGDVNGDGLADAIWTSVPVVDASNWIHVGLATGAGSFRVEDDAFQVFSTGSTWSDYEPHLGDFNGDGLVDLMWNALRASNDVWLAHADPALAGQAPREVALDEVFSKSGFSWEPGLDWSGYRRPIAPEGTYTLTGNIDGEAGLDLVWIERFAESSWGLRVRAALSRNDSFVQAPISPLADEFVAPENVGPGAVTAVLADVAGNDRADLVISAADGRINRIYVGLSRGDGSFEYQPATQQLELAESASADFGQYELRVGNFGCSAKSDLVWVLKTSRSLIYTGIAK